jgi:hypothetical protein
LAADADGAVAATTTARAAARERVWQVAGTPVQHGRAVIDIYAMLVTAHSEKQDATRTWKKGSGFHPLLGFVDHGGPSDGEPVAELLRPGKAGSNTAADHVSVLDAALAQLRADRRARDGNGKVAMLVRIDAAGATKEFAAHLHATRSTTSSNDVPPPPTATPIRDCSPDLAEVASPPPSCATPPTGARSSAASATNTSAGTACATPDSPGWPTPESPLDVLRIIAGHRSLATGPDTP